MADEPYMCEDDDPPVCGVCPSLRLPRDRFVVADRPSRLWPFNEADGYRYAADGTPVCVHPDRIGLDPDRIALPPKPLDLSTSAPPRHRWFRRRK
ncbi:hypothetical protein [Streptomyces silvisoli]|uniref:Uncharacterized protein n=1 Tax=Streptomyces silvisoli TaxID=3034235 RepID=A0ABT5ZQ10_9ACTN|nr:hypothetical protein [Streptomyces silvisoli]MDF3291919.1 hypothetical protein [Streptomyces silvisoli]